MEFPPFCGHASPSLLERGKDPITGWGAAWGWKSSYAGKARPNRGLRKEKRPGAAAAARFTFYLYAEDREGRLRHAPFPSILLAPISARVASPGPSPVPVFGAGRGVRARESTVCVWLKEEREGLPDRREPSRRQDRLLRH